MEIDLDDVPAYVLHGALAQGSPPPNGLCGDPQPEFGHDLKAQRDTYDDEPVEPRRINAARSLCRRCPGLRACQRYAVESAPEYGFLAGLTASERLRRLSKRDKMEARRRRIRALADRGISTAVIAAWEDMHATSVRRYMRVGTGSLPSRSGDH